MQKPVYAPLVMVSLQISKINFAYKIIYYVVGIFLDKCRPLLVHVSQYLQQIIRKMKKNLYSISYISITCPYIFGRLTFNCEGTDSRICWIGLFSGGRGRDRQDCIEFGTESFHS